MRYHVEVLGAAQQRVLRQLAPVLTRREFYLVGGTALALHLGHRRSVDLDWFTPDALVDPSRLAEDLRRKGLAFRTGQIEPGTLHGTISRVQISLLEYRYRLLKPLASWPAFGCRLASQADLAAMKLAALAQRGAKKDFIDVYALLASGLPLKQLLAWYQQKYSVRDIAHVLYSLCYFEDADKERTPRLLWDTNWKTMKLQLREWLQQLTGPECT